MDIREAPNLMAEQKRGNRYKGALSISIVILMAIMAACSVYIIIVISELKAFIEYVIEDGNYLMLVVLIASIILIIVSYKLIISARNKIRDINNKLKTFPIKDFIDYKIVQEKNLSLTLIDKAEMEKLYGKFIMSNFREYNVTEVNNIMQEVIGINPSIGIEELKEVREILNRFGIEEDKEHEIKEITNQFNSTSNNDGSQF